MSEAEEKRGCCVGCKKFFLYNSHDPVVQAFYLNQFGRSALFISFMFLSLGILQLANEQAGCPKTESGAYACTDENKVYGSRPSSILALMALAGGLSVSGVYEPCCYRFPVQLLVSRLSLPGISQYLCRILGPSLIIPITAALAAEFAPLFWSRLTSFKYSSTNQLGTQ